MIFHDYLLKNLSQTAMISLSVNNGETFQYNYWNWFHKLGELHLLKDDYSIGHILHDGNFTQNEDGSITYSSTNHPKHSVLNFYFGGVSN